MKRLRVRKWLKIHREQQITITHDDYQRLGFKTVIKILRIAPQQGKLVSVQSQDFHFLSGNGKPGVIFSNLVKEIIK